MANNLSNIEAIRKINPCVIKPDGTLKSFKEQLLEYEYGYFDQRKPFVISADSGALTQAGAESVPLVMSTGVLAKIKGKHDLYLPDIGEIESLISEYNVLMLDSYTHEDGGLCMYIDAHKKNPISTEPLFAAFHLNKEFGYQQVNELKSLYVRRNIVHTIKTTWRMGHKLYPNKNTAPWLVSNGLQLPADVTKVLTEQYKEVSTSKQVLNNVKPIQKHSVSNKVRHPSYEQDVINYVRDSVNEILRDEFIHDVYIVDVQMYGSRKFGNPRADSDINIALEFKGDMRINELSSLIAERNLNYNGLKVEVNPITGSRNNVMKEFISRAREYTKEGSGIENKPVRESKKVKSNKYTRNKTKAATKPEMQAKDPRAQGKREPHTIASVSAKAKARAKAQNEGKSAQVQQKHRQSR